MVKRGGTKRKITKLEKITKREYLATAFSKRCSGLHSKAAQLCLLGDAQIAILATPPSSQSNVSFYSFGHTSVDAVVNAYLTGQRLAPVREEKREEDIGILMARKELGLEMWWEKESLSRSKDPRELMDAMKAMERVLCKLRSGDFFNSNVTDCHEDLKNKEMTKSDVVLHDGTQDKDETLNFQSDSAVCCNPNDIVVVSDEPNKIAEEQDQILAVCDSFCAKEDNINGLSSGSFDVYNQEMDIDELIDWNTFEYDGVLDSTQEIHGSPLMNIEAAHHDVSMNPNPSPIFVSEGVGEEALVFQNKAWDEVADDVSTNLYPIYDFEGVEEEGFVFQNRALDVDNLQFSDYFNYLTNVADV